MCCFLHLCIHIFSAVKSKTCKLCSKMFASRGLRFASRAVLTHNRRLGLSPLLRWGALGRSFSQSAAEVKKPTVLCILDGWGYTEQNPQHNAVHLAKTPNFDSLMAEFPHALLEASEEAVGLPAGQFGNSEVGHMNIGAGRVIYQDILRIRNALDDGSLQENEALQQHINKLQASGGTCHLMGLTSQGGVHGMQDYMAEIANVVHAAGVPVVVHVFTDGRDTAPKSALESLPPFLSKLDDGITVGTVTGRFYAMDRDTRWDRVGQAYDAMVHARAPGHQPDPLAAVSAAYEAGHTDEFVQPTVINGYEGMKDGDGIMMTNFRADRAREILQFLGDPAAPDTVKEMGFGSSERPRQIDFADKCGIVEYSSKHNEYMSSIFPPKEISDPFGAVVSAAGMKQLRCAETEKYPHVTFFFNGGVETVYEGEDRLLIDSPRDVATYDERPEMSASVSSICVSMPNWKPHPLICCHFLCAL